MIIHPHRPAAFAPTDLSPREKKGAYLETPHRELLLLEAQRQIKLRSRHIAAGATRLYREATGEKSPLAEAELVKIVELVGQALGGSFHSLTPFSREAILFLNGLVGTAPGRVQLGRALLRHTVQAAEAEISFHHYLLYSRQADLALGHLRRLGPGLLLEPNPDEPAGQIAAQFLRFCSGEADARAQEQEPLQAILADFFRNFAQVLRLGSEAEVVLNTCRFWSEQFATRYTLSLQEWQFLLSNVEQGVIARVGLDEARALTPLFEVLDRAILRLGFAGEFHRQSRRISDRLAALELPKSFDGPGYLQIAVAEMVLAPSRFESLSPRGLPGYRREIERLEVSSSLFQVFAAEVIQTCRPLAERSELDWLEVELRATFKLLHDLEERLEAEPYFQKLVDTTTGNLRQGLNVFRTHTTLAADLSLILDEAQEASRMGAGDLALARATFRRSFSLLYAANEEAGIWQHGTVIVSALLTGIRQSMAMTLYWKRHALALELIEDIGLILEESRFVVQALPHLGGVVPPAHPSSTLAQKESPWLLRRALEDFLTTGATQAPRATLDWFLHEVLIGVNDSSLGDFAATATHLRKAIDCTEPFADSLFAASFHSLVLGLPAIQTSSRLWSLSEQIALEASTAVYARLPGYEQASGERGVEKCARDNAITLRRVALAFAPAIVERTEFVENWWNNLVNTYIVNRPDSLFSTNGEELARACETHLNSESARLVQELLAPIFRAVSHSEDRAPTANRLIPLASHVPLAEWARADPHLNLAAFYTAALVEAFRQATGQNQTLSTLQFAASGPIRSASETTPELWLQAHLDKIAGCLVKGLAAFEWNGTIDRSSRAFWASALAPNPAWGEIARRFLSGLIAQADSIRSFLERIRVVHYLEEQMACLDQVRAGLELQERSEALARALATQLHAASSDLLGSAPHPPNGEKCGRDLALLLEQLAQAFITLEPTAARLQLHRYLAWHLSPHITYGEGTWRRVWQVAAIESIARFSPATCRFLSFWWQELEGVGRTLPIVGAIHGRFVASSDSIFSLDPEEEAAWRSTLSTLLALYSLQSVSPQASPLARVLVAQNDFLNQSADFEARLDRLPKLLRNWFIDLDLKPIYHEFEAFKSTRRQAQILGDFARGLPGVIARAIERIPALSPLAGSLDLVFLRWARAVPLRPEGTLSPLLLGLAPEVAAGLGGLTESDRERLRVVLINASAEAGGSEQIGGIWQNFQQLLRDEEFVQNSWNDLAKAGPLCDLAPFDRDVLRHRARKLLIGAWSSPLSPLAPQSAIRRAEPGNDPMWTPEQVRILSACFEGEHPVSHRAREWIATFLLHPPSPF